MSAPHAKCLNCGNDVVGKFCSSCGQKVDTQRITTTHFITHDLVHGVWHVDRGMFFTLKESILNAGKAASEYIEGKRIKYYNVFYLSLLLLGANILLKHFADHQEDLNMKSGGDMAAIAIFLKSNIKIILLLFIPVISIVAFFIYKKSKLNLAEHAIIAGFLFCGMISLSIIENTLSLLPEPVVKILDYSIFPVLGLIKVIFPAWAYYQALSKNFSKLGFVFRTFMFYLLTIILYVIIILAIVIIFNYIQTGKMEIEGELLFG